MTIKEAMNIAHQHKGSTIFYDPKPASLEQSEAVVAQHGSQPKGFLLWCDCSKAAHTVQELGLKEAFRRHSGDEFS